MPKGRYLYLIEDDGAKIGIVVATLNPSFFEHALNKAAMERVLASLRNGKIDEGYVVFARVDNSQPAHVHGLPGDRGALPADDEHGAQTPLRHIRGILHPADHSDSERRRAAVGQPCASGPLH